METTGIIGITKGYDIIYAKVEALCFLTRVQATLQLRRCWRAGCPIKLTFIVHWGCTGILEKNMETTIVHWGSIGILEKNMETTIVHRGCTGILEKNMETTIVHRGYVRILEKNMETTI